MYCFGEAARVSPPLLTSVKPQIASTSGVDVNAEETVREVVAPAELVSVLFSTRVVSPKFKIRASVPSEVAFAFAASTLLSIFWRVYVPSPLLSINACGINCPASYVTPFIVTSEVAKAPGVTKIIDNSYELVPFIVTELSIGIVVVFLVPVFETLPL